MSFTNAQELEAYTHEGRRLVVPEPYSWVSFDCSDCGTRTETLIERDSVVSCDGCEAFAVVPEEWST